MTKNLWVAAFSVVITLFGVGLIFWLSRPPQGDPIQLLPPPTPGSLLVYVTGAVANPGVYAFAPGARVQDAVQAAGGMTDKANLQQVNLAALLVDGQRILVPLLPTPHTPSPRGQKTPTPTVVYPLDLNTATSQELESLPGIGPVTAQKIVDFRLENGLFLKIEDIQNVPGIGKATFAEIKDLIKVSP